MADWTVNHLAEQQQQIPTLRADHRVDCFSWIPELNAAIAYAAGQSAGPKQWFVSSAAAGAGLIRIEWRKKRRFANRPKQTDGTVHNG